MDIALSHIRLFRNNRLYVITVIGIITLILLNIFSDYYFSQVQNTRFYFSESFLFSIYWFIFLPTIYFTSIIPYKLSWKNNFLLWVGLINVHHVVYPFLIFLVSHIFYNHTFSFYDTFQFGITNYLIISFLIYGFISLHHRFTSTDNSKREIENIPTPVISSLIINDIRQHKIIVDITSIYHINAATPYVELHTAENKHLYKNSLKNLIQVLPAENFVRIHKSTVVNLHFIESIQSRQNGDYDIYLKNGQVLRMSRNYLKEFKSRIKTFTQVKI